MEIYTDGSSIGNPGPGGYAYVVVKKDAVIHQETEHLGNCTNNYAEYYAVYQALNYLFTINYNDISNQKTTITIYSDSLLVINQVNGLWKVKNQLLRELYKKVKENILQLSDSVTLIFKHIRAHSGHEYNEMADSLANNSARNKNIV